MKRHLQTLTKSSALLSAAALTLGALMAWIPGPAAEAQAPDVMKQLQPSDAQLKQGATLFAANCASCHGEQGKGDGLAAAALNPKPRNFHSKDAWKNGQTFAGLFKTLEEGIPGSPMGAFNHLSAQDRVALINHIRSLAKANYPDVTAQDVETLQKNYQLTEQLASGGEKAVIPVAKAIELLIEEDAPKQAKVKQALGKLQSGSDKGSMFITDSSYDQERMLNMLVNAGDSWRGNVQDFSKMVMYNAEVNGFRSMTGSYNSSQWSELQNALKKLL